MLGSVRHHAEIRRFVTICVSALLIDRYSMLLLQQFQVPLLPKQRQATNQISLSREK